MVGPFVIIILGIILLILGIFMLIKPRLYWSLTESWKLDEEVEPSVAYTLSTQIFGTFITLVGIVILLIPFLNN